MASSDNPVEPFKQAVVGAARAISEERELELTYSAQSLPGPGRLPMPSRDLTATEAALVRGSADAIALRLKHHDKTINSTMLPVGNTAKAIFEAAEQARIEALGSKTMDGIAQNLAASLELNCRQKGYDQYHNAAEVPLADVVGFMVRERLTGAEPPNAAKDMVNLLREIVELKAGEDLDALDGSCEDQKTFAKITRQIIADLDLADELGDDSDPDADGDEMDEQQAMQQEGEGDNSEDANPEGKSVADVEMREDMNDDEDAETVTIETEQDMDGDDGDQDNDGQAPWRPDNGKNDKRPQYRTYTEEFDEIILAEDLADPEELHRLRTQLDRQLDALQGAVAKLANRLQRRLMAQQNRSWEFDLEEGLLDTSRLTRIIIDPHYSLSFKQEKDTKFRDTVVTLLLDNSGSMRGRPITIAAICADILARTLECKGRNSGLHHARLEGWPVPREMARHWQARQSGPPE